MGLDRRVEWVWTGDGVLGNYLWGEKVLGFAETKVLVYFVRVIFC